MAVQGLRLSPQQRRLWLLQPAGTLLRTQAALRIDGSLDSERLRQVLLRAIERHEILRTTFRRTPGITVPIQVILDEGDLLWQEERAGEDEADRLAAILQAHEAQPLELERGPLVQATLLHESETSHLLVLTVPAVAADFQTLRNLLGEIARGYETELPAEDEDLVQYFDFSEWQHELLEDEDAPAGAAYWEKQAIDDLTPLTLPFAQPVSAKTPFRPASVTLTIGPSRTAQIEALAQAHQTTPAIVMLAAWQTLLWRLIGDSPIVVGYTFSGRKHEELEGGLGLFATVAPVATAFAADLSFREVLTRVERAVSDAGDWQEYFPWEEAGSNAPNASYFPLGFEYQAWPEAAQAGDLTFSLLEHTLPTDRFEARLLCFRTEAGYRLDLQYDAAILRQGDVKRLQGQVETLLSKVLLNPDIAIDAVEILSEAEREQVVVTFNQTQASYPNDTCVHTLLEEQVARTPDRVALVYEGEQLTFAELNARANQLAHYLRRHGVGPETLVALRTERSLEMVVGLLGTLKAGGAYVPLDLLYPQDRLEFMLQDTGVPILLTQSALADSLDPGSARRICLDQDWEEIARESRENPPLLGSAENTAYVIYTSGSTGKPKGVMVPHRGLVNYLHWAVRAYGAAQGNGAPVHSPIGFDLTITSLYVPLMAGKAVRLLPEDHGIDRLSGALLAGDDFSLVKITPAHLDVLSALLPPDQARGRTRGLVIGGEALTGESLAFWLENAPDTRLINEYGPTETTVGCCIYEVPARTMPTGNIPIGRPIANTQIYLLDAHLYPVPVGVPGELYIGGDGLARGYLNRPQQTAERFIPDPFSATPGARLYRTGDLARYLPEGPETEAGTIEFLGRNDDQVKIRGYRIELGEVEAVLTGYPAVREGVVVAYAESPVDKRLIAYFTTDGTAPMVNDLREYMALTLPDYMIPSLFIRLDEMPLTVNGKVDYRALPEPDQARPELQVAYQAPESELEQTLTGIWARTLGIERIGVHDSFFALGGDSIRSVRAVALAKEEGVLFTVQELFQHPTIHALARHVEHSQGPGDGMEAPSSDEELLRMLEELEGLSDEEAQARLQDTQD